MPLRPAPPYSVDMELVSTAVAWVQPILLFIAVLLSRYLYNARRRYRLPPGPKPLPLLGNVLDMPTRDLGASFRDLNVKYGDVVYLDVLGQPMIILGSYKATRELLEVRSAISSDRSESPMADLTGFMWDFGLEGYTPRWRTQRRAFHQLFYPNAVKNYRPTQLHEVQRLLQKLLDRPDDFVQHIRHYFGASILGIVYGLPIDDDDDKYLTIARKGLNVFINFLVPGRYMVESLHFLRHLPSWFPGAGFKRQAAAWRKDVLALRNVPFDAVEKNIANGDARPCIATALLEQKARMEGEAAVEFGEMAKDVCALAYITGADTTFSSVVAFFLAMVIFPDVQKKAQDELDAVIGPNRLPGFDDRPELPYINAVLQECLRWHVVATIGMPHRTTAEQVYNGYYIPKGTAVISNAWALSRDPEEYPDPEAFRPERFLSDPPARDPATYVFGNGRRICAGRHFADSSLFIIVASVLHTLNIRPPLDASGKPVQVEPRMTADTLLSYPEPFKCRIEPRSAEAEARLRVQDLSAAE
ncbi:CyP450 monooxygenase [Trametes polyzona]|nr:CyP450 monooxygenase [Trametes polyzona]